MRTSCFCKKTTTRSWLPSWVPGSLSRAHPANAGARWSHASPAGEGCAKQIHLSERCSGPNSGQQPSLKTRLTTIRFSIWLLLACSWETVNQANERGNAKPRLQRAVAAPDTVGWPAVPAIDDTPMDISVQCPSHLLSTGSKRWARQTGAFPTLVPAPLPR